MKQRLCSIGVWAGAGLAGLHVAGLGYSAEPAPKPALSAPPSHVLFVGANLAVEKDRAFHPVQDVTATAAVINPVGKPVNVPLAQENNFRVTETLKLTDRSITLSDYAASRDYSPRADSFAQLVQTATLAAGESAVGELAQFQGGQAAHAAAAAAEQPGASSAGNSPSSSSTPPLTDVGARAVTTGAEAGREEFDAIRLRFKVTADRAIGQPYYAVIATIRDPGSRPGQVRKWVHVKSLGALSAGSSTTVDVYQAGFTPGYLLESCHVHFFDRGEELATNLSRRRVELSEDEALEYRIVDHIAANKGRTRPASLATTALAGVGRETLTAEQLGRNCHVGVDKNGRVTGVFSDAAGKRPLSDRALESAFRSLRFTPALDAGKPVESLVAVKLADIPVR